MVVRGKCRTLLWGESDVVEPDVELCEVFEVDAKLLERDQVAVRRQPRYRRGERYCDKQATTRTSQGVIVNSKFH